MIEKYISINRALRSLSQTIREIIDAHHFDDDGYAIGSLKSVALRQVSDLDRLFPSKFDKTILEDINKKLESTNNSDCFDIVSYLLPPLENCVDDYFYSQQTSNIEHAIIAILHPAIIDSSFSLFKLKRYRDAVLNSIVAVFDLIRLRTSIDKDGSDLVGEVFSLTNPKLVVSTLETESGRNDQKGFIQLLNGLFQGVRNPKAHTLTINPTETAAAQYLVFSSLLCRRIEEANFIENRG